MNSFEEEIIYFNNLVFNNIQLAKVRKGKKAQFEAVFFNVNVRLDGEEIALYNQEQDTFCTILKKDIEDFNFKLYLTKHLALYYMNQLTRYSNNEITFEEFAEIKEETKPVIKELLKQKNNVSEQLKLLRSHRNFPEVQEYIDKVYNDKFTTEYIIYLIDRYYYNKKNLIRPKKTGLEAMFKVLLH